MYSNETLKILAQRAVEFNKTSGRYLTVPTERVIDGVCAALERRGLTYELNVTAGNGPKTTRHVAQFQ